MQFYEKFLNLCNDAGIKPTTAAEKMGFKSANVYRWKNGSTPTDATLLVIANFFGVAMDDLRPDDEMNREKPGMYLAGSSTAWHENAHEITNVPADFSEDDKELFDLMRKYRDNPAIRIMFHEMDDADPAQALEIIDMIQKFKQGRR